MTYTLIDTTPGGVKARVRVALVKQAALRAQPAAAAATAATPDGRERSVCTAVVNGSMPESWVTMVLIVLDIAGVLANPADSDIDTVIATGITTPAVVAPVWTYLIATASAGL